MTKVMNKTLNNNDIVQKSKAGELTRQIDLAIRALVESNDMARDPSVGKLSRDKERLLMPRSFDRFGGMKKAG